MTEVLTELPDQAYWRCEHEQTQLCAREASDGRMTYWWQCLTCGKALKQVRKTEIPQDARQRLPLFDEQLRDDWYKAKRAEWDQQQATKRQEEQARFWRWYGSYLRSPAWKQRRELVLERDNGRCRGCLRAPAVHVHHLTYDRVGDELLFDLIAVCQACHQKAHPDKTIGVDD